MRSVSTIFLFLALAAMFYMSTGQYVGLSMSVAEAEKESQQFTSDSPGATSITFSSSDIAHGRVVLINGHELRYEGHLYDIISQSKRGNMFSARVSHDEKEETIISQLGELVQTWFTDPAKNRPAHPSFKLVNLLVDIIPVERIGYLFSSDSSVILLSNQLVATLNLVLDVVKSPPRIG